MPISFACKRPCCGATGVERAGVYLLSKVSAQADGPFDEDITWKERQLSALFMCTKIIARSLPNETTREAQFAFKVPMSKLLDNFGVALERFP